jgi:hypothetical protein
VGLPPGLAFGARVVGLEATFEAGDFLGLIGIAGAAAWVVSMVAAARAIGLPAGRGHPTIETFPRFALALAALMLIAGPALPLVMSAFAIPAQGEIMPAAPGSLGSSLVSVVTVQTDLPALTLFAPLLLLGAIAYGISGGLGGRAHSRPPLFTMPGNVAFGRLRDAARSATLPEQYRSIVNPRALERAAAGGRPFFWLAMIVALAYAVNR